MLRVVKCSFCGSDVMPGTGIMFVKQDGTVYHFCSSKCKRNMLELRRKPAKVKWARRTREQAEARRR